MGGRSSSSDGRRRSRGIQLPAGNSIARQPDSDAADRDATRSAGYRAALIATLLVAPIPLIFPGDAPWINDEPAIIARTLNFSDRGVPADSGLQGAHGLRHGPLPLWLYQTMLSISEEPVHLVLMRAGLVTCVTALSLFWLARSLGWWAGFIPVVLASPYLWFYSRLLWDNSFGIPLSTLLMAAYAALLSKPTRMSLALSLASLFLLFLTHLMTVALVVPVAAHLLVTQRSVLRRYWVLSMTVVLLGLFISWPYLSVLRHSQLVQSTVYASGGEWTFTLWGGRSLTATGLDLFFGPAWMGALASPLPTATRVAAWISSAGYALVWLGGVVAAASWIRAWRRAANLSPAVRIAALAMVVIACQTALDGLTRVHTYPHYHHGTWACYVLLAWSGVEALRRRKLAVAVAVPHGLAMLFVLVVIIARVHATGGTRGRAYGPVLSEQLRVARVTSRHSPESSIQGAPDVPITRFPHSLDVLHMLVPYQPYSRGPRGDLFIRYASADPNDARLTVLDRKTGRELLAQ